MYNLSERDIMAKNSLHACSGCKKLLSAEDFLHDPNLPVIGMGYKYVNGNSVFFFFNHDIPECGTTILLEAEKLTTGMKQFSNQTFSDGCRCGCDFGITMDNIYACDDICDLDPYKELLKIIKQNKRGKTSQKPSDS